VSNVLFNDERTTVFLVATGYHVEPDHGLAAAPKLFAILSETLLAIR